MTKRMKGIRQLYYALQHRHLAPLVFSVFIPSTFSTSHLTRSAPLIPIQHIDTALVLRRFSHANNTAILSLKSVQMDDRWSPSPIPPIWNAVGGLRACVFFFFFSTCSHSYLFVALAIPSFPLSTNTFYTPEHAQDAPSCEEMSGVLPPAKYARSLKSTQSAGAYGMDRRAHTHTLSIQWRKSQSSEGVCIDFLLSLVLVVPVWHSLVNAGEVTITARVKPITFQGYRETPGVRGVLVFVALLPHCPLFSCC